MKHFLMTLSIVYALILYLTDLLMNEGGLEKIPVRMRVATWIVFTGVLMVVISQFTGLYYTFDEMNRYVRSPLYPLSIVFPTVVMVIILSLLVEYRKSLRKVYL